MMLRDRMVAPGCMLTLQIVGRILALL